MAPIETYLLDVLRNLSRVSWVDYPFNGVLCVCVVLLCSLLPLFPLLTTLTLTTLTLTPMPTPDKAKQDISPNEDFMLQFVTLVLEIATAIETSRARLVSGLLMLYDSLAKVWE